MHVATTVTEHRYYNKRKPRSGESKDVGMRKRITLFTHFCCAEYSLEIGVATFLDGQ